MVTKPVLGLIFHLVSGSRSNLDLFVACGLFVGTVFYMSRIARTCVAYGIDDDSKDSTSVAETAPAEPEKPYDGPYLAG
ncbi:MAG: hypothetical protein JWN70_834 [Planctomycetaceae bacterium]|nr:hypothetical protein [Planctomycetaceae bacterium]